MKLTSLATTACLMAVLAAPAFAHQVQYSAVLSGLSESPTNTSPGTGNALVTIDLDLLTMNLKTDFSGMLGNLAAAHLHCCTAIPGTGNVGVATQLPSFTGFPTGVTAGTYDHTFDMALASSYNPSFVTANGGVSGAFNKLVFGLNEGRAYLNLHTTAFPGGEVRGFLTPVPEPETYGLAAAGIAVGRTFAGLNDLDHVVGDDLGGAAPSQFQPSDL